MRITPHSYKWAGSMGRRIGDPPYIVIHYSASDLDTTVDEIHEWHLAKGWRGFGYHAAIYPSGKIVRGRPWWAMGAHCIGHNECLGIVFITKKGKLTPEQIESGYWLVHRWRRIFEIPRSRVKRHRDMSGNNTACPGVLPMVKVK